MTTPLRVLLLEDRADDAQLIMHELRRAGLDCEAQRVETKEGYLTALEKPPDLILSDYTLPGFNGLDALRLLRERGLNVPFVFVSGTMHEELAVASMQEGAADYLFKDRLARLGPAVQRALEWGRLHEQRQHDEETARQMAALVQSSNDAILSMTLAGIITSWNPAGEKLYGWPAREALGRHVSFLVPAGRPNKLPEIMGRLQQGGGAEHFETVHLRKDATLIDVSITMSPILDNQDKLVGASTITRDITERKRLHTELEARLRQQEVVAELGQFALSANLTALLDRAVAVVSATLGTELSKVLELRSDGRSLLLRAGVGWHEGLVGNATVGAGLASQAGFTLLSDQPVVVEDLRSDSRFPGQPLLHDHGAVSGVSVIIGGQDRPFGVLGTHTTTQRSFGPLEVHFLQSVANVLAAAIESRKAQEAQGLAEGERDKFLARIRIHIDRGPLAYLLTNADLCILDWNPAAERIFGYSKKEVLGMGPPYEKIYPPEAWPEAKEVLRRLRSGDMTAHAISQNRTKDDRTITCEWYNTPLLDAGGSFEGVLSLAQDITEKRSLEEQFRQAQKMEAIGRLAGGVAHDFNNLLTIISGYSELLLRQMPPGKPERTMVEEIHKAGERSAALTRQLLVFSRHQVVAPKVLDLNAVVADAEKMLHRMIGEDLQLKASLAVGLGSVRADEGQLQQVLMNLAVNARDAMPQGGQLTIETRNVELGEENGRVHREIPAGPYVLLVVSDTGCGMTQAVKARIFEPFFTTKELGKGTGLGLAVVHGVVQQAGGHLEVDSKEGGGTTFKIYLPRLDTVPRSNQLLSMIEVPPLGTETVLLIEDDDGVRFLTRHMLKSFGYRVLVASGGGDALSIVEKHPEPIHLVITDVVMPGMSGRQVAGDIVRLHPETRVLFISGYTDDAVVRHGILQEKVHFLPKPFLPFALACKIREVLDAPVSGPTLGTVRSLEGRFDFGTHGT